MRKFEYQMSTGMDYAMMQAKTLSGKGSKNTVGVRVNNGMLSLRLPRELSREVYSKPQEFISLGLADTPKNRKIAESKAERMSDDIAYGCFDATLEKYEIGKRTQLAVVTPFKPKDEPTLLELWNMYCEYRKHKLEKTTYQNSYRGAFLKVIQSIPSYDNALKVREFILGNYPPELSKRVLSAIEKCYRWASKNKLIRDSDFTDIAGEIKIPKTNRKLPKSVESLNLIDTQDDYRAFTAKERDAIIAKFDNTSRIKHWTSFVKFLFWTGCRPGEAIGLRWKHIKTDSVSEFAKIHFCEAYGLMAGTGQGVFKATKTDKGRYFKCGQRLQELMQSIKPEDAKPDDLVFTTREGKVINWRHFTDIWRGSENRGSVGVIPSLLKEGKISLYLKPYATRHTYITLMLNEGINAIDIAKNVGNSAEVILEHYASATRDLILPEV